MSRIVTPDGVVIERLSRQLVTLGSPSSSDTLASDAAQAGEGSTAAASSPLKATLPRCSSPAWMVKRSEIREFGEAWLQRHGLSVGSEGLGFSSRVLRAA